MAKTLNQNERGERPNTPPAQKRTNMQKKKSHLSRSYDRKAYAAAKAAELASVKFSENIFPNLDVEEHRRALIESCINTNEIFKDNIADPSTKSGNDIRDYMFYNQLYFLAASQISKPSANGSLLPGIVGGLSMIAGAALVSEKFRNNLKDHVEDGLLKYVEPFKGSAPKLWATLNAKVESHPGCVSPESVAMKLLRYQKQAYDMIESGDASTKYVNSLLLKRTSELKQAADNMNIDWDQVIQMRDTLSRDMTVLQNDREQKYGHDFKDAACRDMDEQHTGLSDKIGGAQEWKCTSEYELPIDVKSAARKLVTYQKQLQEAVEGLHDSKDGDAISSKFSHLSGKTEDQYFASSIKQTAELKAYVEKVLHLDWNDVTDEYDKLNAAEYDKNAAIVKAYEKYVDPEHRSKDGAEYGKHNELYHSLRREGEQVRCPSNDAYENAKSAIRDHNLFMYYELPVDADSAGRCLKKYQQDAYENVRDIPTRHNYKHASMSSNEAYYMSNELCKQVKAASSILGFDWKKTIREYRKDVYKTILKDDKKSAIWKEISGGDIIANIPDSTITYIPQPNGPAKKEVRKLNYKERIASWDGAIYDSDGNPIPADSMIQVRDPYTKEEAKDIYTNLFSQYLSAKRQEAILQQTADETGKDVTADLLTIRSRLNDVNKRCDEVDKSLIDDHFSPKIIAEIRNEAMEFFNKREDGYSENYKKQYGSVELDESLAPPETEEESDYPRFTDSNQFSM